MIDLTWSDAEEAFRQEARSWLTENLAAWKDEVGSPIHSGDTREGFAQTLVWEKMLSEGRWAAVSWPEEYGGRDATPWEWLIFEEEYSRSGAPARGAQNGIFLLAPSLYTFGTQQQQDYIIPRLGRARTSGARGGPSRTPVPTWPACGAGRRRSRAVGC